MKLKMINVYSTPSILRKNPISIAVGAHAARVLNLWAGRPKLSEVSQNNFLIL